MEFYNRSFYQRAGYDDSKLLKDLDNIDDSWLIDEEVNQEEDMIEVKENGVLSVVSRHSSFSLKPHKA